MDPITREEIHTEIRDGVYFTFVDNLDKQYDNNIEIKKLSELNRKTQKRILNELITQLVIGIDPNPTNTVTKIMINGKDREIQTLMTQEVAERIGELSELEKQGKIVIV